MGLVFTLVLYTCQKQKLKNKDSLGLRLKARVACSKTAHKIFAELWRNYGNSNIVKVNQYMTLVLVQKKKEKKVFMKCIETDLHIP